MGLFKFYEYKQIPNILLGLPCILLSTKAVFTNFVIKREETAIKENLKPLPQTKQLHRMLPFKVHLFVTIFVAVTVMHVQVVTRFVCASSPLFFWYCAKYTMFADSRGYSLLIYFTLYAVLGSSMFCSFYPWT